MSEKRSSFSGKIGFVLAAAGSAVGLGNIWRFPYLAAQYGGGIFLLVYIALAVTFGFALLCAEIAIGRKTGTSAINAFGVLNKKYSFIGWLASIVPMIILPYYCVIGGWVMKYIWVFATGGADKAAAVEKVVSAGKTVEITYYDTFVAKTFEPVGWFLLFIGLTALVVLLGVEKGIEKVSKIMMPILIALTVFIAVYTLFMDGAIDGLIYYIKPDFSKFSFVTVLAALGQLFYSMSIAMGIMITYGSYMKKDISIESSVRQIEIFDTGIAFLAGLMIVPGVFAFSGGNPEALNKGAGLMFMTLPKVFNSMPAGSFIGAVFFILVFFAALTSSISLMETVVSIISDKTKLGRKTTSFIVLAGAVAIGIFTCFGDSILSNFKIIGFGPLGFFDFISNSIIMPIVAILTCIFIGYVIKPKAITEEIELTGKFKAKKMFTVIIKYVAPICILLILGFSVLEGLGIITV